VSGFGRGTSSGVNDFARGGGFRADWLDLWLSLFGGASKSSSSSVASSSVSDGLVTGEGESFRVFPLLDCKLRVCTQVSNKST
jgi:hypothetical protein